MRNSVKIFIGAFLAILLTGSIFAQEAFNHKNPEKRAEKMTARLTEALSLSTEQTKEVKAIILNFGERKAAMRAQKANGDREAMHAAKKQMRTDFEAAMKSVLNEAQYQKFQELPKSKHRGGHHGRKGAHKALKEKMKPILLEQRAKLEPKISEEDKVVIAQLREAVKVEMEERRKEMGERRKEMGERRKEMGKEERKAKREARKNSPTHLKIIELVEKYSADIEPLLAEVKPQVEAMKQEMREERGKKEGGSRKGERRKNRAENGKREASGAHHKNRKYAHFLLLDSNAIEDQAPLTPNSVISEINVYPNPSQGLSQIEYELKEAGMVTIELRDKEGNLVETIERANKRAGQHKTSINFSQYTVGIYYVVLKDANGQTISKKVIR